MFIQTKFTTDFFFNIGIYFLALAKLAALFFLLIFAFRSLVHLRARYRTGNIEETVGSERNRLLKSKNKIYIKKANIKYFHLCNTY